MLALDDDFDPAAIALGDPVIDTKLDPKPPAADAFVVYRSKINKIAPYCKSCKSFNFILLAAPSKKSDKERAMLVFAWDRLDELATYFRAHGTAVTDDLDKHIAALLTSGSLLAFGTTTNAADLLYAHPANGHKSFEPSADGADGLFGTVAEFLDRFPLTDMFCVGATNKPHSSAPGWSIALNAFAYSKFRSVFELAADYPLGRAFGKSTDDKPAKKSAEKPAKKEADDQPATKKANDKPAKKKADDQPAKKKADDKPVKKSVATKKRNDDETVREVDVAGQPKKKKQTTTTKQRAHVDEAVPLDELWKKREPYTPMYGEQHPRYEWPERAPGEQALFTKMNQPPLLTYYNRVEHDRCVGEYIRLNALSPNPRPAAEVELMATRYLIYQWSAIPPDEDFLREWVNFLGKYSDQIVRK